MVTKPRERLLTTKEVANRMGVTQATVIRAIRRKQLKAQKMGWFWVVNAADLPRTWKDREGPES